MKDTTTYAGRRKKGIDGVDGFVVSSPLTFGTQQEYYSFNLDYLKQSNLWNTDSGNFRSFTNQQYWQAWNYQASLGVPGNAGPLNWNINDPKLKLPTSNPYSDSGVGGSNWGGSGFVSRWNAPWDDRGNRDGLYWRLANSPYGSHARRLEDSVGSQTFAGLVNDFRLSETPTKATAAGHGLSTEVNTTKAFDPLPALKRPTSAQTADKIIDEALAKIKNNGPITDLIHNAPNGFLISLAQDFDVQFGGQITDFDDHRRLSDYWPERLGGLHPLRDVYDMFYSPDGRYWQTFTDVNGKTYNADTTSIYKEYLTGAGSKHKTTDWRSKPAPAMMLLGPVSNRTLKLGDGNTVIAASPVMTPVVYRNFHLSDESGDNNDELQTDTVLYPSSVGAYQTNVLELGKGDHVVYYDSSFKNINAKKGNQIFLPSFGSFNWSIDWIPGFQNGRSNFKPNSKVWEANGRPLISPIPWDDEIIHPGSYEKLKKEDDSYVERMAAFSKNPVRGTPDNQNNYLYTIAAKAGALVTGRDDGKSIGRTFLNARRDADGKDDPLVSRNPVNRLGGTWINAGKVSDKAGGGAENFLEPTGNKVFYGMDWELWNDLLPKEGATLVNNGAGRNDQKRPALHEWNTITLTGGRGNNTFFLGNIFDNITNNGLLYNGDYSYEISLTHDNIYAKDQIREFGNQFANVYSSSQEGASPYLSTVNLNLQSDPSSYSVMIQAADPGQKGNTLLQKINPWLGVTGLAQKLVKTPLDLNKDWVDNWTSEIEYTTQKVVSQPDLLDIFGDKTFAERQVVVDEITKIPKPQKWINSSKFLLGTIGQVFPWIDLGISAFGAVKGIIEFFSTKKEDKPPEQELRSLFFQTGMDPARKAVRINDWNPYTKINLNIPSFSKSDWDQLKISLSEPDARTIDSGAYINVMVPSIDEKGVTTSLDKPLVILENMDKDDSVDGQGFAYYTYSFLDPDGNGPSKSNDFNPIGSTSLRFFGRLADPAKNGSSIKPFDQGYVYLAENGFDMRNDAENYLAFYGPDANRSGHYSKVYFDREPSNLSELDQAWSVSENLKPLTSNISLEFDSRVHGWYWQPVYKLNLNNDGSLNADVTLDPKGQELDFKQSKLWIYENNQWAGFSFAELDSNLKAFRYSKLASTYFASSKQTPTGSTEGRDEINKRLAFDAQLRLLEDYVSDLYDIDQRLIAAEYQIFSFSQIKKVEQLPEPVSVGDQKLTDAIVITFHTVTKSQQEVERKLLLHKQGNVLRPAVAVNSDLSPVAPSTFQFNYLVDSQRRNEPFILAETSAAKPLARAFAGSYDPVTGKTHLFEYVPSNGIELGRALREARTYQLPQSIGGKPDNFGHLATINSQAENDAITGLVESGNAWVAADNGGRQSSYPNTIFWQWTEGDDAGIPFWSSQKPGQLPALQDGPVGQSYSNWKNPVDYQSSAPFAPSQTTLGVSIDLDSGHWNIAYPNTGTTVDSEDIRGYVVEYSPIEGLPSLV